MENMASGGTVGGFEAGGLDTGVRAGCDTN